MKKLIYILTALASVFAVTSCNDTLSMAELTEKMNETVENAALDTDDKDRPVLELVEAAKSEINLRNKNELYENAFNGDIEALVTGDARYHTKSVWFHIKGVDASSGVKYFKFSERLLWAANGENIESVTSDVVSSVYTQKTNQNIVDGIIEYDFRNSTDGIVKITVTAVDWNDNESLESFIFYVLKDTKLPSDSFKIFNRTLKDVNNENWKDSSYSWAYKINFDSTKDKTYDLSFDELNFLVRKVFIKCDDDVWYENSKKSSLKDLSINVEYAYHENSYVKYNEPLVFDDDEKAYYIVLPEYDGSTDTFIRVTVKDEAGVEQIFNGTITRKTKYIGTFEQFDAFESYCSTETSETNAYLRPVAYMHYEDEGIENPICYYSPKKFKKMYLSGGNKKAYGYFQTANVYNKDNENEDNEYEYILYSYPSDKINIDFTQTVMLKVPGFSLDARPGPQNSRIYYCHLNVDYTGCNSNPAGTMYYYFITNQRDPDDDETIDSYNETFEYKSTDNPDFTVMSGYTYTIELYASYEGSVTRDRISEGLFEDNIPPTIHKNGSQDSYFENGDLVLKGIKFDDPLIKRNSKNEIIYDMYFIPYRYEEAEKYKNYTLDDVKKYQAYRGITTLFEWGGDSYDLVVPRTEWKNLRGDFYLFIKTEDTSPLKNYTLYPYGKTSFTYADRLSIFNPWYESGDRDNPEIVIWSDYRNTSFEVWNEKDKKWEFADTLSLNIFSGADTDGELMRNDYKYVINYLDKSYYSQFYEYYRDKNVFVRFLNYTNNNAADTNTAGIGSYYYYYPVKVSCNLKNIYEGTDLYTILCDKPCFVHTIWGDEDYGDVPFYWELYNYADHVSPMQISSSVNYVPDVNKIPNGKYYRVIAYFADGTSAISKVHQKK